ncbi:GNAT family N-acetyltransferase [Sphingorhabdus sp. SMR4y]|uniref:GNAT family N-acetyltransferase n=1 Tax=Sphingorhabdus sp. SMR4y TaxID=2584094 RepID=UPI000B5CEFCA|nr:GNAT family N-acetyltransferase [Sphingorhabdus sp. SMR4y]ASK89266.1 acetyltransferase (GNAT) domain protein [Sphingorhabdus sp. SMR4y]
MTRFRPYLRSDKQACLALFDGNVPEFFDATERDEFAAFLDRPGEAYFVIEQEDAVIGCGGFAREVRGQARFTWGMVDRNHHGDGLGRLLAEHRLRAIVAAGAYSEVELFTTPKIAPFFARFGFVQIDVEKDGFAPGMDRVQMIKTL